MNLAPTTPEDLSWLIWRGVHCRQHCDGCHWSDCIKEIYEIDAHAQSTIEIARSRARRHAFDLLRKQLGETKAWEMAIEIVDAFLAAP